MTQHQENELAAEWRKEVKDDLNKIREDVSDIKTDLAAHKVKTGLWAMVVSAFVSVVAWLIAGWK